METIICKKCKEVLPKSFGFCPLCGANLKITSSKPSYKKRGNGEGTIRKMSGKRTKPWELRIKGKYIATFATKTEAEAFAAKYKDDTPDKINLTLQSIYERWQTTQRYQRLSKDAKNGYKSAWTRLAPQSQTKMRDMKTLNFQQAVNLAVEQGYGRDICEKIRSLCSLLCQEAMKDDIIDKNYALGLELPPRKKTNEKKNFSNEDIIKLLYADDDRDARIVLCMIYTGMRSGELFEVKSSNVHLSEGYLIGGFKTEAGTDRSIPIREEIVPYVQQFLAEGNDYLIASSKGGKMSKSNYNKRHFYPLLDRLGIEYKDESGKNMITPHRTRHTYISESIAAGIAPEALTKIVGHSNYSTSVNKYNKVTDIDYLRREASKGI